MLLDCPKGCLDSCMYSINELAIVFLLVELVETDADGWLCGI